MTTQTTAEEERRSRGRYRLFGLAALSLAAGIVASRVALSVGVRPEHLATGLAVGFAGLAGVGKRAAP